MAAVHFSCFQSNTEGRRLVWRSFAISSSVPIPCAYCYRFCLQAGVPGMMQVAFFSFYSLLIGYGLALMLGAVPSLACSVAT